MRESRSKNGTGLRPMQKNRHSVTECGYSQIRLDSSRPNLFNTRFPKTACSSRTDAQVAQSVEQGTENPRVGGSIPPLGTIIFL